MSGDGVECDGVIWDGVERDGVSGRMCSVRVGGCAV